MSHRQPPFGFLSPDEGGPDLYFNERLLGDGLTWAEFEARIAAHGAEAPVLFTSVAGPDGRARAQGVTALSAEVARRIRGDDDVATAAETREFLERNPDRLEVLKTKPMLQQEAREAASEARDELYQRQNGREEELWQQRSEVILEARGLRDQAAKLREQGQRLWAQGHREEAKERQRQAKELSEQASMKWQEAERIGQRARGLDRTNADEMFEYVQAHHGRPRDGTWIDLHGLTVEQAKEKTLAFLLHAMQHGIADLEIITGAGHHSQGGVSVVKQEVLTILKHPPAELRCLRVEKVLEGSVYVNLGSF